jgi:uncharacterized membrane protein
LMGFESVGSCEQCSLVLSTIWLVGNFLGSGFPRWRTAKLCESVCTEKKCIHNNRYILFWVSGARHSFPYEARYHRDARHRKGFTWKSHDSLYLVANRSPFCDGARVSTDAYVVLFFDFLCSTGPSSPAIITRIGQMSREGPTPCISDHELESNHRFALPSTVCHSISVLFCQPRAVRESSALLLFSSHVTLSLMRLPRLTGVSDGSDWWSAMVRVFYVWFLGVGHKYFHMKRNVFGNVSFFALLSLISIWPLRERNYILCWSGQVIRSLSFCSVMAKHTRSDMNGKLIEMILKMKLSWP